MLPGGRRDGQRGGGWRVITKKQRAAAVRYESEGDRGRTHQRVRVRSAIPVRAEMHAAGRAPSGKFAPRRPGSGPGRERDGCKGLAGAGQTPDAAHAFRRALGAPVAMAGGESRRPLCCALRGRPVKEAVTPPQFGRRSSPAARRPPALRHRDPRLRSSTHRDRRSAGFARPPPAALLASATQSPQPTPPAVRRAPAPAPAPPAAPCTPQAASAPGASSPRPASARRARLSQTLPPASPRITCMPIFGSQPLRPFASSDTPSIPPDCACEAVRPSEPSAAPLQICVPSNVTSSQSPAPARRPPARLRRARRC